VAFANITFVETGFGRLASARSRARSRSSRATASRGAPARPAPPDTAAVTGGHARALTEAAAGRLRPLIGQRFPLERAAGAPAAIEDRATLGKTLLVVRPPVR
jgi:NADPH:quinone reductase-like Zn-dependent oxidoreductase